MMTPTNSLNYRKAALEHASTVGLVIALYDTLLGNLGRAAEAMDRNNIELRCAELAHGFNVLQQLEIMVDMRHGGPTAINLHRFYSHVRGQMLAAQFQLSPSILREQIQLVIDIRGAWQQVDARGAHPAQAPYPHSMRTEESSTLMQPHVAESEMGRISFSCSG